MPAQKPLARADRLLKARRYAEVLSLLESQVFLYRDSAAFYRILGTACLYTGDYGGAHSYLQRAEQLGPGNTSVQLGLAAVSLRRREVPTALRLLLEILDREPGNQHARRALAMIRRTEDPSEFVTMAESGALRRVFPPIGYALPRWVPMAVAVTLLAAAAIVFIPPIVRDALSRRPQRTGAEAIARTDLPATLTASSDHARYTLTDAEVARTLDRIGEYFNSFRDNLARREANRLLLSNAGPLVKERVRLVSSYFRVPTFADFSDNFSFADVEREPWLYEGTHVRWSGQTTNISLGDDAVRFTLLVGYQDQRVLDGTVNVTVPFAADVQPGAVELIGRVNATDAGFSLTATSIRRIVVRSQ